MNISFGKKIPVSTAQVYSKDKGDFTRVTLYEFDGKDSSDVDYFINQKGNWGNLKYNMGKDIFSKFHQFPAKDNQSELENKFYSLEEKEGKSIGLCETSEFHNFTDIKYIECSPEHNYKFAGQSMIAGIAKNILKHQKRPFLGVTDPVDSARTFYTETCGFTPMFYDSRELQMDESQMRMFISKTENKTHSPIVDIQA